MLALLVVVAVLLAAPAHALVACPCAQPGHVGVAVQLWGGGGGRAGSSAATGGAGGWVEAHVCLPPGAALVTIVGSAGLNGPANEGGAGGYPNGGGGGGPNPLDGNPGGGGGGGSSALLHNGQVLAAAGGGGGGGNYGGGGGGGAENGVLGQGGRGSDGAGGAGPGVHGGGNGGKQNHGLGAAGTDAHGAGGRGAFNYDGGDGGQGGCFGPLVELCHVKNASGGLAVVGQYGAQQQDGAVIIRDCNHTELRVRTAPGTFVYTLPEALQPQAWTPDSITLESAVAAAVNSALEQHLSRAVACAQRAGTYDYGTSACTAATVETPPASQGQGAVGLDAQGNLVLQPTAGGVVRMPARLEADGGIREVDALAAELAARPALPAHCLPGDTLGVADNGSWACAAPRPGVSCALQAPGSYFTQAPVVFSQATDPDTCVLSCREARVAFCRYFGASASVSTRCAGTYALETSDLTVVSNNCMASSCQWWKCV